MAPVPGVDIVLLTALGLEFDALHAHLADPITYFDTDGTRYAVGDLQGGCRVALALIGEGNLAAAALTGRAIQEFSPVALFFVGVAGALKDDVAVGDVVVATRVHAYHGGREENDVFRPRPKGWPIGHGLEQTARAVAQAGTWAAEVPGGSIGAAPQVHFKPIVSGDVVLDSRTSPLAGFIAEQYSDAIAIDMEGAGVAEGAHRKNFHHAMTIRGISDAADGAKRQKDTAGWQLRAAANAAAFAAALAPAIRHSSPAAPPAGAVHRFGAAIRRGGCLSQVLSAILVATVSVLVYIGVTAVVDGPDVPDPMGSAGPGGATRTSSTAINRADPNSWVVAGTGFDVVLADWRTVDIETGATGDFDADGNDAPGTDLGLSHNGTRLRGWVAVLHDSGEPDVARCLETVRYTDGIYSNLRENLTVGRDVCVRTEEDNLALLTVDQSPSSAFPELVFHFTLWKPR